MTTIRIALFAIGFATVLGTASRAEAVVPAPPQVSVFQLAEWACADDPDSASPRGLRTWIANNCSAKYDSKDRKACDKISGTPWACYDHTDESFARDCLDQHVSVTMTASVSVLGWEIKGTVRVTIDATIKLAGDVCKKTPDLEATGNGGKFVSERGVATLVTKVKFEGTGSVSFLGLSFGAGFEESCDETKEVNVYRTGRVYSCEAAEPTLHTDDTYEGDHSTKEPEH